MKTSITFSLSLGLLLLFLGACTKNAGSNNKPATTLTLSNKSVKVGEPLVVTTSLASPGLVTRWSVAPMANTWASSSNNRSVMLFSKPGTYTVTASYFSDSMASSPYDSSSSPVTVSDSLYGGPPPQLCNHGQVVPINPGDQIIITPISYSDTGLQLLAHTQQLYNNYPYIADGGNIDVANGGFVYNFSSVIEYPCAAIPIEPQPQPAIDIISFGILAVGTYNVVFNLNNTSYQGSLTVTDTLCTFSWGYTSGITIYPLQINK